MLPTVLALAEVAEAAGDRLQSLAVAVIGVAMLVAFVATVVVTPRGGDHH
jgi:hypothetical protein